MRVVIGDVLGTAFVNPHVWIQVDCENHVIREGRNYAFLYVPFYGTTRVAPAAFVEFSYAKKYPFRMFKYVFGRDQVPVINRRVLEKACRIVARKNRLGLRSGRVTWVNSLASKIVCQGYILKSFR